MDIETPETRVLSSYPCELGEGPAYDAGSDTAWWFDILGKTLFEHRFGSGETMRHPLAFMASQLSFIDDATQMVAGERGLFVRDIAGGRLTLHTPLEADDAATRSNDGRVHPAGALWIGTMGTAGTRGAGAIYWFFRGELRRLFAGITTPNAICFSADGTVGYFTDTADKRLMRVALDAATGLPTGAPAIFADTGDEDGGPDGAVIDADGLIWNARWGGGRIDAYAPDGRRVRRIAVPARQPSCPVFVGAAFDRMLVTTAREGLTPGEIEADGHAGRTLLIAPGAIGRAEPRLRLG